MANGLPVSPANIDRVARNFGSAMARWAFTQCELRTRAKQKFARSEEMLFVREALEQATSEDIAAYHASLFPPDVLVADLTTGIGGDLIALAQRGSAIGFELDPERAEAAQHNLAVANVSAEVRLEDSMQAEWEWDYAIADPARRMEGRRTLDPSEFSPNPMDIAERFAHLSLGVIKLSPLLPDPFLISLGPSLRFLSCEGECREALICTGKNAISEKLAVHVESGDTLIPGADAPITDEVGSYFFDADPAAVRSHCLGTLSERYELRALGDSRGYLTGNVEIKSPWLRPYRVLYSDKADMAKTKKMLQDLGAATPEIKQRLADQSPEQLRKTLKSDGKRRVSLAIWPMGRSLRHTLLEQLF